MKVSRTIRENTVGAISVSEIPVPAVRAAVPAFNTDELTSEELRNLEDFMRELFEISINENKDND